MARNDDAAPAWKTRRLEGGDWVSSEAKTAKPRADRTIPVKMTEDELADFDAQIATLGMKRNRALRIAARRIAGFVEVTPEQIEVLKDATRQLTGIARNINQIAKSANRTRDPEYGAFMEERAALGRELVRIEGQMQAILNLAARRADGLARLERAAEE